MEKIKGYLQKPVFVRLENSLIRTQIYKMLESLKKKQLLEAVIFKIFVLLGRTSWILKGEKRFQI